MILHEIKELLKGEPRSVRRVLPRNFISTEIKRHLQSLQDMAHSFRAVLTFPTTQREFPQHALKQLQQQFSGELKEVGSKIDGEVDYLLSHVKTMSLMQSHIMLDVVSKTPAPYCLLNEIELSPGKGGIRSGFVQCYVILWVQQIDKQGPITIWVQLAPVDIKDNARLSALVGDIKSAQYTIRFPVGEVAFIAFNTVISVTLHDLPSDLDALLTGKTRKELVEELKTLRSNLLRQKGQKGNFIHLVWRTYPEELLQNQITEYFGFSS
jgi:hypothetical protein